MAMLLWYGMSVLPSAWSFMLVGTVFTVIAGANLTLRLARIRKRTCELSSLPNSHAYSLHSQLVCCGDDRELEVLEGIQDRFFEPKIFVFYSTQQRRTEWVMLLIGIPLAVACANVLALGHLMTLLLLGCLGAILTVLRRKSGT